MSESPTTDLILSASKAIINELENLIEYAPDANKMKLDIKNLLREYDENINKPLTCKLIIKQIHDLLSSNNHTEEWLNNYISSKEGSHSESTEELHGLESTIDNSLRGGDSEENKAHLYPVWFGTNREPIDSRDLSKGFKDDRAKDLDAVYYGKCEVSIPKTHRFGEIGRAWWQRWASLDFKGNDELTLNKIHGAKNADQFWKVLSDEYFKKGVSDKEAVVFLHGYNNSFEDAALRAAQIGFDLKVRGFTTFFSWPSKNKTFKYPTDEASIIASESAITEFLIDFVQKSGAEKVHLIAHSMGNRGLLAALKSIMNNASKSDIKFGQIILAAPDLDVDVFRQAKDSYTSLSDSTTLYTSSTDIPVAISKRLHEYPRLGIVPPITIEEGIDTIKVNNFNLFNLGHGYFAEAEALLQDIYDLVRHGESPDNRQRPHKVNSEENKHYWVINTK